MFAGGLMVGIVFGLIGPAEENNNSSLELLSSVVAIPVLAKMGIDSSRNYGKLKLIELKNEDALSQNFHS